jgi:hypothetical protein
MASPTKITEFRRKRKLSKQGKKRKAKVRREGSTKSKSTLFGE